VQFSRLRLSGFKSFVETTELVIEPGLTGIVGPNGCGKSNLIDALRWGMGEHSARQLRGTEMDDIIFAGTQSRPPRNIAEVGLVLENDTRTAPAAFNDQDEIEITRRIERGSGTAYRVNGSEMRQRDVQTLFADAATGARSTAIVSQGQIGALIAAKPTERRAILEEAAGITGLYSRRHEAELRLKAAEANLARLEDVINTLEAQLQALKRQARQASRYRNLSDHIRRAEAQVLHHRYTEAAAAVAESTARLAALEQEVARLTTEVAAATTREAEASSALPPLREAEAEAAAKLQRLKLAREELDREEERVRAAEAQLAQRLAQIAGDTERERGRAAEAMEAASRLDAEAERIQDEQISEPEAEIVAREALELATADRVAAEAALARLTAEAAAAEARLKELSRRRAEAEARATRLNERLRDAESEAERLEIAAADRAALAAAEARLAHAQQAAEAARAQLAATEADAQQVAEAARVQLAAAETKREDAEAEARRRDEDAQAADAALAKLAAEDAALKGLLAHGEGELWPPLIDAVTVTPGYEAALGIAFGDDLTAPADEAAPVHWRTLPPLLPSAPLPDGVRPLSDFVRAPAALVRRLSQIGVIEDGHDAARLAMQLRLGQRLVSRDGALWRWDGYTVSAGAPTAAAVRLGQHNRRLELAPLIAEAEAAADRVRATRNAARDRQQAATDAARAARDAARDRQQAAADAARVSRDTARQADNEERSARDSHASHAQKAAQIATKLDAVRSQIAQLAADRDEAAAAAEAARFGPEDEQALVERRGEAEAARDALSSERNREAEAARAHDDVLRQAAARRQRLVEIGNERQGWQERADTAQAQIDELEGRRIGAEEERARLAARPAEIMAERHALDDMIGAAENERSERADALATAESTLNDAAADMKKVDGALRDTREERVRTEGLVAQAAQTLAAVEERIAERVSCLPSELLAVAEKTEEDIEALPEAEARLARLTRERDNMGPVNLRAEEEAKELGEQITGMTTERDDLVQAIARLRHGINELNREGRERFLAAFEKVNTHFQTLFTRLFGGGRAHLELTEAEDPLEAGLEIMASPPGKKLQVLSLLSGGERALTTTALLFAVFLTNPAPICVLDEVEAPLDDANVGRFCNLVEEIAAATKTRFLLVTHHRITMARMDRLYGVTMPERGVSQLVSVDLQGVNRLRAIA
jgi:chromosome segregation protein